MKVALLLALLLPVQLAEPPPGPVIVKCPDGMCAVPEEKLQAMIDEVIDLRRALNVQCAIVRRA